MKVKVISVFRDKFTGRVHLPGESIEIEDETRIEDLKERKLVEVNEEKKEPKGLILFDKEFDKKKVVEALKAVGAQATGNMGEATLLGIASKLDEEATAKLKETLGIE